MWLCCCAAVPLCAGRGRRLAARAGSEPARWPRQPKIRSCSGAALGLPLAVRVAALSAGESARAPCKRRWAAGSLRLGCDPGKTALACGNSAFSKFKSESDGREPG